MKLVEFLPWLVVVAIVIIMILIAINATPSSRHAWLAPAAFSALFFAWSLSAAIAEGPLGFWTEHTRNMWGNQIWFDLLLAVGIAWYLIVPRARSLGMPVLPWLLVIVCTGCIGFLALVARVLYLQENTPHGRRI